MRTNTDAHSRRFISEFPGDEVKCIEKLQSLCANMTFAKKSRYDRTFQQVTHKGEKTAMNYIEIFQNAQAFHFRSKTLTQRINYCTYYWITFTKIGNILLK